MTAPRETDMAKDIDPFNTDFLTDKSKSDETDKESYIIPNIETKLPKRKRDECREIVKEIKEFGVSQRQLLYTIYLLSLELENVEAMRNIAKVVGEVRETIPVNSLHLEDNSEGKKVEDKKEVVPSSKKKLII